MPYITAARRQSLFEGKPPISSGELNYILTLSIIGYLEYHGRNYSTMNDIIGALDQAKDEFRRRVVHPYEEEKIQEHGDVY